MDTASHVGVTCMDTPSPGRDHPPTHGHTITRIVCVCVFEKGVYVCDTGVCECVCVCVWSVCVCVCVCVCSHLEGGREEQWRKRRKKERNRERERERERDELTATM